MKLSELQKIIRAGGCATLDKNGKAVDYPTGYQVSKIDGIPLPLKDVNKILQLINDTLNSIGAGEFVGLWINEAGQMCVDISERIPRLSVAMRLGMERGQDAIYDWTMRRCIATR